jgi:hypothetical protein
LRSHQRTVRRQQRSTLARRGLPKSSWRLQ